MRAIDHEEQCEERTINYDSLFSIGDSVLVDYYISQAEQKTNMDSLNASVSSYQGKLRNREKVESEIRERIIYHDTVVYRKEVKTLYTTLTETIRDTVYVTDTIRDTVYVKKQRKRK